MSYKYQKAKSLIKEKKVKIVMVRPGRVVFNVDTAIVSYNYKGWLCDFTESNENYQIRCTNARNNNKKIPTKWSCSFNREDCEHIIACKILMKKIGLGEK